MPNVTPTPHTATTTTSLSTASPARVDSKNTKSLSKTTLMTYRTELTSTPQVSEVFVVTPASTMSVSKDRVIAKRGKVKYVTLTPGYVTTTKLEDANDFVTMSSTHVQKVTKAPANIPHNFISTVVSTVLAKKKKK